MLHMSLERLLYASRLHVYPFFFGICSHLTGLRRGGGGLTYTLLFILSIARSIIIIQNIEHRQAARGCRHDGDGCSAQHTFDFVGGETVCTSTHTHTHVTVTPLPLPLPRAMLLLGFPRTPQS